MISRNLAQKSNVLLLALLVAAPPVVALVFTTWYGADFFLLDDFCFIPVFQNFAAGKLTLAEITAFHNEHRHFLARIVMIALGIVTSYSSMAQMYASWLFVLVSLFIVYPRIAASIRAEPNRDTGNKNEPDSRISASTGINPISPANTTDYSTAKILLAMIPVSACLFSLRDYERATMGAMLSSALTYMLVFVCFFFLSNTDSKANSKMFLLAASAAFLASFSGFAGGVMVWPVGLLIILLQAVSRRNSGRLPFLLKARAVLVWCALAIVAGFMFYGTGIRSPLTSQASAAKLMELISSIGPQFFLRLLGSSVSSNYNYVAGTIVLGIILGSLYLALRSLFSPCRTTFVAERLSLATFGCAFLLFGLSNAFLITFGRVSFGNLDLAAVPRYVEWTSLALLGSYLIALSSFTVSRTLKSIVLSLAVILIGVGYTTGILQGGSTGPALKEHYIKLAYYLSTYKQQGNSALSQVYPLPEIVSIYASILETQHWNVFANQSPPVEQLPKNAAPQIYRLDYSSLPAEKNGAIKLDRNEISECVISGWAFDKATGLPSKRIYLRIGAERLLEGICGRPSRDLAAAINRKKLDHCGFLISFSTKDLQPGRYPITLVIADSSSKRVFESPSLGALEIE